MGCTGIIPGDVASPRRVTFAIKSRQHPNLFTHVSLRRFPVISGFRVSWDSRREAGNRVLGVWLLREAEHSEDGVESAEASTPKLVDFEPIERNKNGQKYKIVTREYMAEGHDGFLAFQGNRFLIDDESGSLMSAIVRKYLLGEMAVKFGV